MFCNQCEQVSKGGAASRSARAGKNGCSRPAGLLVYALKGLSLFAVEGRKKGVIDAETDEFAVSALFSTLTNVNFDAERFVTLINKCVELRERLKAKVMRADGHADFNDASASFVPEGTAAGMVNRVRQRPLLPMRSMRIFHHWSRRRCTVLRELQHMPITRRFSVIRMIRFTPMYMKH